FAAHPDCYFQVFTNGQMITNDVAKELRKVGNVTPLISVEGTEIVSDQRRGRLNVLSKSLEGIENCRRNRLITGVATSVCQGDIEPCPIIQFARETIHDNNGSIYETFNNSAFLRDFRQTAAKATRGCVVLERPDLVRDLVRRHQGRDTTQRGTALAEMESLTPRHSQHNPVNEVPEDNWVYRFAKKHWFFGFGAYT